MYYLQSRYYDPEIGRFINADAFAATGQGLLGNNMFAYCGNNPVTYSDPSGHAYQGIYSQINYNEYDHTYGGLRENFYSLSCLDNAPPRDPSLAQIIALGHTAVRSAAAYAVSTTFQWYGPAEMFITFWEVYDACRFAGLSNPNSFVGAGIFAFVPDLILDFVGNSMARSTAMDVTTNVALDLYIDYFRPLPEEAARNRTNHIATKGAAITVGGSMSSIAFGQLEVRDYRVR